MGSSYREIVEIGAGPNHYACAHMELFEGNEGFNFDTESGWGNSIYGTVFRNHWTGLRRSASPLDLIDAWNRRAVGVQVGTWWYSFVGNVLGFQGMPLLSGTDFQGGNFNQTALHLPVGRQPPERRQRRADVEDRLRGHGLAGRGGPAGRRPHLPSRQLRLRHSIRRLGLEQLQSGPCPPRST